MLLIFSWVVDAEKGCQSKNAKGAYVAIRSLPQKRSTCMYGKALHDEAGRYAVNLFRGLF
jgi:hypothetical protein